MGTASFSVANYGRTRGTGAATVISSRVRTSGQFTTSGTADNIEDAGGDISMASGEVLRIHADEAMRVSFGAIAATTTTGHYIPAGVSVDYECEDPGVVSIIDVA